MGKYILLLKYKQRLLWPSCTGHGKIWLAYEPHHSTVAWAAVIDDFEPLHGDPRWNEFLKRVNLPRK